jgi:hypothetical protein
MKQLLLILTVIFSAGLTKRLKFQSLMTTQNSLTRHIDFS